MPSRRTLLRTAGGAGLAATATALAGCAGDRRVATRIEQIVVGNWQDRPNTIHLLVLCDGDVTLWRTYDLAARPNPSEDPPQGAVIDDLPDERTDCRVVARLNDGETAERDLAEHDLACTELHVQAEPAERGGGLTIFHRIDGECG